MGYRGYRIKRGPFGWFATPIDEAAHTNEERYGYSVNMDSKLAVKCWIDDKIAQSEGADTMTDQEIFELLAELECKTFYLDCSESSADSHELHDLAKKALLAFAEKTGCANS